MLWIFFIAQYPERNRAGPPMQGSFGNPNDYNNNSNNRRKRQFNQMQNNNIMNNRGPQLQKRKFK